MTKQSTAPTSIDEDTAFAERLRAAREERGFTQGAVATRTKWVDPQEKGVSRTAIIGYEQGATKPSTRELRLLCEVLHVTPNKLIYGTDSAGKAALPSLEFFNRNESSGLRDVLTLSLALLALKGHERDSLLTLVLSLAGRQLGDKKLSSLLSWEYLLKEPFFEVLTRDFPEEIKAMSLEQMAEYLADQGMVTNQGNRFRMDPDEGEILNPEAAVYPDPPDKKS